MIQGAFSQPVNWTLSEGTAGGTISGTGLYTAPLTAGIYHVVATSAGDATKTASAEVTVPVGLSVTPASVALNAGAQQAFNATVTGSANTVVMWTIEEGAAGGSITSGGLYTAPAGGDGTFHVVATTAGTPASQVIIPIAVTGANPITVTVVPTAKVLAKGGTQTFVAVVGGTSNTAVTWSTTGGSIDASGQYTAPDAYGTFTVTASSVADPNVRGEATVLVPGDNPIGTITYDANGNMTSDGKPTYEWDAENRLVAVNVLATGHRSEFGYDELGRRVEIAEKDKDAQNNLILTSDKKYLWVGVEIAEERSADGAVVTKRFYDQGFIDNDGTTLFYTRDHLGSIRELTDSTQAVRARYDYDPFGRMAKISGDKDTVFGFTGHFWHGQSGMFLTPNRAYDPNLGRWISRDLTDSPTYWLSPTKYGVTSAKLALLGIEKASPETLSDGPNLYTYVAGDPINKVDILGLQAADSCTQSFMNCMKLPPVAALKCLKNLLDNIDDGSDFFKKWRDISDRLGSELKNKSDHIFDNAGHNLDNFLKGFGGNRLDALEALEKAGGAAYRAGGLKAGTDVTVTINGTSVTIRGAIINGVFRIGTAFR